ncbi:hypothetical protein [Shewanella sp. GD04112]|uniref:hypothetical protein n=1 Tax=Shewanella sp. GD04112 TaxID=2975434 RepID=UPI00244B7433|nr:hypothetical protein [Shewanella sp. GD04112]MDH0450824.1 hypothetical protein [Shewanella sp. GD04112]
MVQSYQQIETILAAWLSVGNEFNPHNKLYRHPEFIFRKAGEWNGWNDFFGLSPDADTYEENDRINELENQAWELYKERFHQVRLP